MRGRLLVLGAIAGLAFPTATAAHPAAPTVAQAKRVLEHKYVGQVKRCHRHHTFVTCTDYFELESSNPEIEAESFTQIFGVGWHGRYLVSWETLKQ